MPRFRTFGVAINLKRITWLGAAADEQRQDAGKLAGVGSRGKIRSKHPTVDDNSLVFGTFKITPHAQIDHQKRFRNENGLMHNKKSM